MLTINGKEIWARELAWDTCHKIYLVNTPEDKQELKDYGYEFYPINELQDVWDKSCELRFVNSADVKYTYVQQGDELTIKEV